MNFEQMKSQLKAFPQRNQRLLIANIIEKLEKIDTFYPSDPEIIEIEEEE